MLTFIKLSENDKRIIFAVLLLIILFFVLIGYLGYLVKRTLNRQGKKLDYYIADPVTTKVITNPKHFVKYAKAKNRYIFFKKAKMSFIIMIIGFLFLVINNIWLGWNYNPFSDTEKGFASLLFLWDFQNPNCWTQFFSTPLYLFTQWPPLIHEPAFHFECIGVYIFVVVFVIGCAMYLYHVTGYIARGLRIRKLKDTIFSKNLDNFVQLNTINENNPPINPTNNNNQ